MFLRPQHPDAQKVVQEFLNTPVVFSRRAFFGLLPLAIIALIFGKLPGIDRRIREALIAKGINSADGRRRLARAMMFPLRQRLDYTAIARKTFPIQQLPDGALPVYDRGLDVTKFIV